MANLTNTLDSPVRVAALLRGAGIDPRPSVLRAALNMDPDRLLATLCGILRRNEQAQAHRRPK